jgi:ParB family chromosome partitioning protein
VPRALRPRAGSLVRADARAEAREQIDQARFGRRLVLRTDELTANPHNPRREFDTNALNQLATSILEHGQLQPVVVRRVDDGWQLICGERRWRAHKAAGIETIEAIEKDATDAEALRLALVENLHREDLSQEEKITALDQLAEWVEASGLNRTAHELRIDPSWLSRRLSLRRDPVVFPALDAGRLSFRQATELLHAPAPARRTLLDRALRTKASGETIRKWAYEAKRQVKQQQQEVVAELATRRDTEPRTQALEATEMVPQLVARLRALGDTLVREDLPALTELVTTAQELIERLRNAPNPEQPARPRARTSTRRSR